MHFEYISSAVSTGLMQVQLTSNLPVLYGVLNCLTIEQAQARCGPNSPLPLSLATTALRMASLNVETKKVLPDLSVPRASMSLPMVPPCSQG
jgi:6,7-dimethyl-8-ribityllumazine synthase